MKIFIDTNIFLDLILKREMYPYSLIIFNAIDQKMIEGVILDITILNIDYIASKQAKNIKEFLLTVNNTFTVEGASNLLIKEALEIENNDLEDNLQYVIAKKSKVDLIVTNDKRFYKDSLKTMTSKEFVKGYVYSMHS
jgi:predicted nucleic acid-binding protein